MGAFTPTQKEEMDREAIALFQQVKMTVLGTKRHSSRRAFVGIRGRRCLQLIAFVVAFIGPLSALEAGTSAIVSQADLLVERGQTCGEFFLMGYVAGAADTAVSLSSRAEGLSLGELTRETERYIRAHPEHRANPGYIAVVRALAALGVMTDAQVRRMWEALPR